MPKGEWLVYRHLDLDETGRVVKASAGVVGGIHIYNASSGARYVKIYNKATAPTQTDTPIMTIGIGATSHATLPPTGAGASRAVFTAGISLRATTGIADNDTGAPTANDVIIVVWYE